MSYNLFVLVNMLENGFKTYPKIIIKITFIFKFIIKKNYKVKGITK